MAAAVIPVFLGVSGCNSLGPDREGAANIARAFQAAAHEGDGARACDLLAPGTVEELEQSLEQPCAEAIGEEKLPESGEVLHVAVYGRGARIVFDGDVVFLSVIGPGWRVIAAGCVQRPHLPYDCIVKGG